jgi:protein-disulfide isomerase
MNKKKVFIVTLVLMVLLFVGAVQIFNQNKSDKFQEQAEKNMSILIRPGIPSKGAADAPVKIVEFFDPACGTCAQFHPYLVDMVASNPGKIQHFVRYAPFHSGSDSVVKILEAAHRQGKFWELLEVLFSRQSQWVSNHKAQPEKVWTYLSKLGLDLDKISRDVDDPEISGIIKRDLEDVATLKVNKTPEFFVNGRPLPKFGLQSLMDLVKEELSRSQ